MDRSEQFAIPRFSHGKVVSLGHCHRVEAIDHMNVMSEEDLGGSPCDFDVKSREEVEDLLAKLREVTRSAPHDPIQQFCQGNCEIVGICLAADPPSDRLWEMGNRARPIDPGRMKGTLTLSKVTTSGGADPKIAKLAQQQMFREVATEIEIPLANGCVVILKAPEGGSIYPVKHSYEQHACDSGGVIVEYEILS